MLKLVSRVDHGLVVVERSLMFIFGLLLFAIMVFVVFARVLLALPTPYQTELTRFFHIWMCFIGSSYLIGTNGHPAVEFISDRIKTRPLVKDVYFTGLYLAILVFLGATLVSALIQVPLYIRQVSTYLEISVIWINGGLILGIFLMILRCIIKIVYIWGGEKK